jgi:transcriptional regulator with XRE-family HTH domain
MSVGSCGLSGLGIPTSVPLPPSNPSQPMQRLAAVRRQQGVSRRALARRLNIDVEQVQQQESESADVPISVLHAWQKALDVPISELLVEAGESLSSPVLERSRLLRLMKTVMAVSEQTKQESIRRMAQTMVEQLLEIMPELAEVTAWHTVGKRRRRNELGVAALRRLADEMFLDLDE